MLTAKIDYLEFTLSHDRLFDLVGLIPGGLTPLDRGWRGYTSSAFVAGGKGRVGWHVDRPEMGVHVSLGSQALAILAGQDERWADLPGMLQLLREKWGGHVTRLDVAFDDLEGALDLGVMEDAVRAGHFTTRWKGGYKRWGWGNQAGDTLNFGSRGSDAFLRAYDKRLERLANVGECDKEHWIRVELQLRRERADVVARLFQTVNDNARAVLVYLAGVVRGYLEFKTPSATDSNKRRWAPAGWWLSFLGFVEKARIHVDKVVRTIQHVMDWIGRQVAPSLALVEAALGSDQGWAFLYAMADQGRARWGPRHRAILSASAVAV